MASKELTVVGGANGVGKTTFALEYAARHGCKYLGADAIAAELSAGRPESVATAAAEELVRRVGRAIAEGEAFLVESTLAGRTLQHTLREARGEGYTINVVYLFLESADACVDRVRERVHKGGHSVPESDIRRRFSRSVRNFWQLYRPLADHWLLIYNSDGQPLEVAVGAGERMSVEDAELFALFQRLVHVDPGDLND